jgi:prevent-host-death family protein
MMQIRPVSDLRNKFTEIESVVNRGEPVFLTKNGYGSMVVMSLERYAEFTGDVEMRLDEADRAAAQSDKRSTHKQVFSRLKGGLHG